MTDINHRHRSSHAGGAQTRREALFPWELADIDLEALEAAEPPLEAAVFDHETSHF